MALSSDWARDWPLLSEARKRLDTIIAGSTTAATLTLGDDTPEPLEARLAVAAFQDIIGSGTVPVMAVRDDCGRITPDRVETLLAAANNTSFLFLKAVNEIDACFDSCRDREIFGARSNLIDMMLYPPAQHHDLQIRFSEVRVNWRALVNELVARGFPAGAEEIECRTTEAVAQPIDPSSTVCHGKPSLSSPVSSTDATIEEVDDTAFQRTKGHPGRKRGSQSYEDDPAIEKMCTLLKTSQAVSIREAARKVSSLCQQPHQSIDADIDRLRKTFSRRFGGQPPPGKTWADVLPQ
jgi:hypothetical protein